jgi:hypothetical protein
MINYDYASEGGMKIYGDGGEDSVGVAHIKSASASIPALQVGRTIASTGTIAALRIAGSSAASVALIQFMGGFISCTSIDWVNISPVKYVVPISCGAFIGGIPVLSLATISNAAAF